MDFLRKIFREKPVGSVQYESPWQPTAQSELNSILKALEQPTRSQNDIPYRIQLCERGLGLTSRAANPSLWAKLQVELGYSLSHNPLGSHQDNVERAIIAYEASLTVDARDIAWGTAQNGLGVAYGMRVFGNRAENRERAIAAYKAALTVFTRDTWPERWAAIQDNLGIAYGNRILGSRADNMEQAIAALEAALTVYSRDQMPQDWAGAQFSLGEAYFNRIKGNRVQNVERAIAAFEAAVTVYARNALARGWGAEQNDPDLARVHFRLGEAYFSRMDGVRAENMERAIEAFRTALEAYKRDAFPENWAATQHNLGTVYGNRIEGARAENIERAINAFQAAMTVYTREVFPRDWASAQHNLGNAYMERLEGKRTENLEEAVAAYEAALQVRTRDAFPQEWAMTQMSLSEAYRNRIEGSRADNVERAIAACEAALTVYTRDTSAEGWAGAQTNLGSAYASRVKGVQAENLERASTAFKAALTVYTRDASPAHHRQIQRNLGHVHFVQRRWREAVAAYQIAIEVGDDLLSAAPSEKGKQAELGETSALFVDTAYCQIQLGLPGEALCTLEKGKARLLAEALTLDYSNLASLSTPQRARIAALRQTIRELEAEYHLPTSNPTETMQSLDPEGNKLAGVMVNFTGRRSQVALLEALDAARRELSKILSSVRAESPDFIAQELDLPDLLGLIPPGWALVAPLFTSQGGAVFVVPHGAKELTDAHVLRLDGFTSDDLDTLLRDPAKAPEWGGWLGGYLAYRRGGAFTEWCTTLDHFTGLLWEKLVSAIYARLVELRVNQVILMPQGGLGLLPLHAAWRMVDGQKRYLLDDVEVRYALSGYALKTAQARAAAHQGQSALVIGVSRYGKLKNLPNVRPEVEAIAACFGTTPLLDTEATPQAVLDQVSGKAYLHLSCHGNFAFGDVNRSALYLVDDKPLSMTDILTRLDLSTTRLVTLSACETGITDTNRNPDEFVGLPAAFIQAGAPGVVSTSWIVEDRSTALLMERFYTLHLKHGKSPSTALREAQLWLRGLTRSDLLVLLDAQNIPRDVQRAIKLGGAPQDRVYESPYYWAAFTYTGN